MEFNVGVTIEISFELREQCVKLFEQCDEFSSPERLRNFAGVMELQLVRRCIPNSDRLDYDLLITKMLMTRRSSLEPALFDLLDALASRYREDVRGPECAQLKEKIREALLRTENHEQAKDYQRLVEISAPGDREGVDGRAAQWIEEAGDSLDECALRITLAVFHGTTFETIQRAKKDLLGALQELVPPPPPDPEAPTSTLPPPHIPLMRRLKQVGAYETDGKHPDWKKVVELKEPELASEALIHVWQLYREVEWRRKLIEWLTSYAAGHSADVRTRAAVAAGILAIKDYRFVRENLLKRWVYADDAEYRTAVGMALGVLAREEDWAAEVQNLLWTWSKSPIQAERWAAVRAYIYVGAYCWPVSEVITRWRDIATSELDTVYLQVSEKKVVRLNNPLHMSLMDAMVRFFVGGAQLPAEKKRPLFAGILEGLKKWIAANEADAGLGVFMFSTLARLSVGAAGNGEADGAPMLLQLASEGPDETGFRAQLAETFEVAMRNGATIIEAQEVLCAWLHWANGLRDNSQLYETHIRALFDDIIAVDGGGRMRGKLAACLRDCGRNRTAQRILSTL
ncbi:MAG TPA: hypothetical protein VIP46_02015 [Pyrinomonadaceae bacterium]